jgi:hypothetical protein
MLKAPFLFAAIIIYLTGGVFHIFLWRGGFEALALFCLYAASTLTLLSLWKGFCFDKNYISSYGSTTLFVSAILQIAAMLAVYLLSVGPTTLRPTVPEPLPPEILALKANALSTIGLILVICSWRFVIWDKIENVSLTPEVPEQQLSAARLLYWGNLCTIAFISLGRIEVFSVRQLLGALFSFAIASIFVLAQSKPPGLPRVSYSFLLALPFTFLALSNGMKEHIIFPLVPTALNTWFAIRGLPAKVFLLMFGCLCFVTLTLYVNYVRAETWYSRGQKSTPELLTGFVSHIRRNGIENGLEQSLARIEPSKPRMETIAIADGRGLEPNEIFGRLPAMFIPRALWPDKPVVAPGAEHSWRLENRRGSPPPGYWSASAGFFAELYLGGGYLGVILGSIIYGAAIGVMQRFAVQNMPGIAVNSLCFLSFYWSIRLEEAHVLYAYSSIVSFFLVWFFVFKLVYWVNRF